MTIANILIIVCIISVIISLSLTIYNYIRLNKKYKICTLKKKCKVVDRVKEPGVQVDGMEMSGSIQPIILLPNGNKVQVCYDDSKNNKYPKGSHIEVMFNPEDETEYYIPLEGNGVGQLIGGIIATLTMLGFIGVYLVVAN